MNDDSDTFTFQIDGNTLTLNKLDKKMDEQFELIYRYYFFKQKFDIDLFKKSAVKFFDESSEVKLHDRFFNNFTILWQILIQNGSFFSAEQVWQLAVQIATQWETLNQSKYRVHKGAAYYFWAVTCILKEDKQRYDEWLDLPTTILGENQGRHDATKFKINRYYWKYSGEWLNLSDDQRFERAWEWHLAHCKPSRSRQEFDGMCKWAIEKFRVKRDELHERVRAERQGNIRAGNNGQQQQRQASPQDQDQPKVKKYASYKYSGKDRLYEEIRLGGESAFLTLVDGKPKIVWEIDQSEERGIIIRPHSNVGMLPTFQYEFMDMEEILQFVELASKIHIDDLYFLVKSIWSDLISTNEKELIVLLSADTVHSYFQEMFVTVHYLRLTGPPGWGKVAILLTFKLLGYRVVLAGDMSGPNLLDILGPIEKCQVSLAEDEFDKIEEDEVKERIYKMGYEDVGFVTRTVDPSSSDRDVRYYNPFGIKLFGGEESSYSKKLGGFNDRTFNTDVIKGRPRRLVKEIKKQMEKPPEKQLPKYRKIITRINFLRKLLLTYKLIHHNDTIEEIYTNIDSRPLELCGPALRLFNSPQLANGEKKALNEIKDAFSHFLRKKGQLDQKTIEVVLYGVLKKLFADIDKGLHIEGTNILHLAYVSHHCVFNK